MWKVWPHSVWTLSTGGPNPSSVYLSPQRSSASWTGSSSRPLSVRRYSKRSGCSL